MAGKSELKYKDALEELETIVGGLQREAIDVDELSYKVKRAVELIQVCKEKINSTEMDVKKILDDFSVQE